MIAFTLCAFAQSGYQLQDKASLKFKKSIPGLSFFKDSLNKEKLNVPFSTHNLKNAKDKTFKMGKPEDQKLMVQGGMPILKPESSFPMPVYKPDSTIQFFMQIKEYKRIPPIDFK
jgi:hypothetical protein